MYGLDDLHGGNRQRLATLLLAIIPDVDNVMEELIEDIAILLLNEEIRSVVN